MCKAPSPQDTLICIWSFHLENRYRYENPLLLHNSTCNLAILQYTYVNLKSHSSLCQLSSIRSRFKTLCHTETVQTVTYYVLSVPLLYTVTFLDY